MDELAEWVDEWQFHPDLTVADLDRKVCQGWMRGLAADGKAEAVRRVLGIALRLFCDYLVREGDDSGLTHNPAAGLELPTPKAPPVPVSSDDDLGRLLRVVDGATSVDRRDTAIVRMLLATGMRRGELVGIDVEHADVKHGELTVTGKGGKARIAPFGNRTAMALRRYLRARARRGVDADAGAPFVSSRATPGGRGLRMTGAVGERTRRCEQAGLGRVHPHMLLRVRG